MKTSTSGSFRSVSKEIVRAKHNLVSAFALAGGLRCHLSICGRNYVANPQMCNVMFAKERKGSLFSVNVPHDSILIFIEPEKHVAPQQFIPVLHTPLCISMLQPTKIGFACAYVLEMRGPAGLNINDIRHSP
ncbi:hypothetical protein PROFUN_07269 [Planoprotostelium fungivorum]|uniref:Uncharacterized protein n=1 Tax=Planoprotostelium fungivorum TaxID=1890364 RepID=A0A2P6NM90_9EUKA|nr:hypothetical protein PROFUN_07269 [Planoprotostelium fungivorum]